MKCCTNNENSIFRNLSIIHRRSKVYINSLMKEEGIENIIPPYMIIIHHHPGITQEYISSTMKIDKGAVAKSIKQHIKNGYIYKEKNPNDKRSFMLYLTPKGEEVIPKIFEIEKKVNQLVSSVLCDEEIQSLDINLKKIISILDV